MNTRTVGSAKEEVAAAYLTEQGLYVKEKNFRSRYGEIDIVAKDGDVLVFVEVKYRKTASSGHPEEAVNLKKSKIICRVCDYYRIRYKIPSDTQVRFDVVAIEGENIKWYRNAFPYTI